MASQKTITRKPSANAVKQSRTPKTDIDDLDFDLEGDKPEEKKPVVKTVAGRSFERNMSGTTKIFTDLFKLKTATVIKYEGWEEENEHPDSHPTKFSHWEHTHPFRTFDKKGSKLTMSTPIGGHFHVIEWDEDPEGKGTPIIKSVSGPMVMGKKRIKGKLVQGPVPANEYDDHTHDIEYIRSSEIIVSATNVEAARVVAWEAQKTAPIPGVTER